MRQRYRTRVQRLHTPDCLIDLTSRSRRLFWLRLRFTADRPRIEACKAGLGIDQELAGCHDLLALGEPRKNFCFPATFGAGSHFSGSEPPAGASEHDERAATGADHGLAGHEQPIA